jgi:hypothetical protein
MSAAFLPLPGGLPSGVPSGPLRWPNRRSYGSRSTTWPGSKPSAFAPAARRLPAALAGLEVVPGRVLGRAAVHLLPDVLQVIALAQGRHHRHRLIPRQPERQNFP